MSNSDVETPQREPRGPKWLGIVIGVIFGAIAGSLFLGGSTDEYVDLATYRVRTTKSYFGFQWSDVTKDSAVSAYLGDGYLQAPARWVGTSGFSASGSIRFDMEGIAAKSTIQLAEMTMNSLNMPNDQRRALCEGIIHAHQCCGAAAAERWVSHVLAAGTSQGQLDRVPAFDEFLDANPDIESVIP